MADDKKVSDTETNADCGVCDRPVRKIGVLCGLCEGWFHVGCEKLSKDDYEKLTELGDKSHWFCKTCRSKFKGMKKEIQVLREDNKALKNRLEAVEKRMDDLQNDIVRDIKEKVIEEIREDEEQERRKSNLVIYNLPEPEGTNAEEVGDIEEAVCQQLFEQEIKVQEVAVVSVKRLGKPREREVRPRPNANAAEPGVADKPKPRPLLVKLIDAKTKWTILKNCKNLKYTQNDIFKYVSVTPDMTYKQRQEDKRLRDELRRRKGMGETNLYISKGDQAINENGRMVLEMMEENDLIRINDTPMCNGTYAWSRGNQRSAIDLILANREAYNYVQEMFIDEQKELYDLSDHNLIKLKLKLNERKPNFNKGKLIQKDFYKTDKDSMDKYVDELRQNLERAEIADLSQLNMTITNCANKTLKSTYQKRTDPKIIL
ncbi:hypothetical protein Pmani_011680 [Petrolisthes manimaculis]|uniref:PHD-type domain-containing protein n=1 Tax=Petrolisthes manimaculis TaxID=1843537 RepID=A0AAE1PZ49_9EUCA|nr:hypothetical protein Pmani_011680 [Petrolisthes manimaculis]